MSDENIGQSAEAKKVFLRELKDRSLFAGWIIGAILIGALAWILCRPLLSSYLMRSVNQSINQSVASAGEPIRLTSDQKFPQPKQSPLGVWYSISGSSDLFFVFTVFQDGILGVFGARVTPENAVAEIIPLSGHARQIFPRLSPGIIKMYSRRIESAAAHWVKNGK